MSIDHVSSMKAFAPVRSLYRETDRNATVRWSEHDTPSDKSEPAKHLLEHPTHKFEWEILTSAPSYLFKRKLLEDLYVVKFQPRLNDQENSDILKLFRHGIT